MIEAKRSLDIDSSPPEKQGKTGRPKSVEKRNQILESASDLLLLNGFTATSMDLVAKQAGVSKQTVYSHFKNKDALFTAVIDKKCREYQMDEEHMCPSQYSAEQVLFNVGNQFVQLLMDPGVIAMYRLVIGEVTSNPHVAELFYQAGPQQAMDMLSLVMQAHPDLKLEKTHADYWTSAFFNLLKGDFHMRTMLGLPYEMTDENRHKEVQRIVEQNRTLIENEK